MESSNDNLVSKENMVTENNSVDNNGSINEELPNNVENIQNLLEQNLEDSNSSINKKNVESNEIDFIKESLKEIENDINEIVNVTIGDEISKEEDSIETDILQSNESLNNPIQEAILKDINMTEDSIKNIEKENDISTMNNEINKDEKVENNESIESVENGSVKKISINNDISNDTLDNEKDNLISKESVGNTEFMEMDITSNNNESITSKDSLIDIQKEINNEKKNEEKEIKENDNAEVKNEKPLSNENNNENNDTSKTIESNNIENKEKNEEDSNSSSDDLDSSSDSSSDFDTDSSDDDSSSSDDEILTKEKVEKHKKTLDKFNEDIDDDNDDNVINLIHSTHEIITLPKVEPITIDIPKDLPITKIGVIQNIVDEYVLVQATVSANYQVLDEDSILLFNDRSPAGRIFETLGPVSLPIYSIRFNNSGEIDKEKYKIGTDIYFNPELAKLSYTQQIKLIKGSDASNQYDEEPGEDEIEFSDDEKEIEYKKNLKNKKKNKGNERKRQKLNDGGMLPPTPADINGMEYEPLQRGMPPPNKNYYNQPPLPQGYKNYPVRKPMPYKPYPNKDGYNGRGRGGRRFYGKYHNSNNNQGQMPGNYGPPIDNMNNNNNNNMNSMNPISPPDMNYNLNGPNFDYYGNAFEFNQPPRPNMNMRVPPPNSNSMIIDYGSSENDNSTNNNIKKE